MCCQKHKKSKQTNKIEADLFGRWHRAILEHCVQDGHKESCCFSGSCEEKRRRISISNVRSEDALKMIVCLEARCLRHREVCNQAGCFQHSAERWWLIAHHRHRTTPKEAACLRTKSLSNSEHEPKLGSTKNTKAQQTHVYTSKKDWWSWAEIGDWWYFVQSLQTSSNSMAWKQLLFIIRSSTKCPHASQELIQLPVCLSFFEQYHEPMQSMARKC